MADNSGNEEKGPFPWHLGIYDAHCHPTDTMSTIPMILEMKTRVLTVMATRTEDQELVAQTADRYGVKTRAPAPLESWPKEERVIPCFGWHPWFSHQMFDADDFGGRDTLEEDMKMLHYQTVLLPKRDQLSEEDRRTFASLPNPKSFSQFLRQTRNYLEKYPLALIGEIGLDRSFRIPASWESEPPKERNKSLTPGGREGRRLSPYRVDIQHQKKLFKAQLRLAGDMQRAVSVHGVQAHGIVFETLQETWKGHVKKVLSKRERKIEAEAARFSQNTSIADNMQKPRNSFPPRICLHSYSGNSDAFRQYLDPAIPAEIYVSFSTAINLSDKQDSSAPSALEDLIKMIPDDRLLVESDLHIAGSQMDEHLEDIIKRLCIIKGWSLDDGVTRLGINWKNFAFGRI